MKKRIILPMVVGISFLICFSVVRPVHADGGLTRNDAVNWARSQSGRAADQCDVDGNGLWCTDLATAYMNYLWLKTNNENRNPWGLYPYTTKMAYAYDNYVSGNNNWTVITRTATTVPLPGDIFVSEQDTLGQGYGHVGIVLTPYGSTSAEIIQMSGGVKPTITTVTWGSSASYNPQHFIRFNYFLSDPIPVHNHSYWYSSKVIKEPTRTASGTRYVYCSCGEYLVQSIPAIPYTTDLKEGIYTISPKCKPNLQMATNEQSGHNVFVADGDWADQYWLLRKNGDGTYSFENAIYDGRFLDVYDNSMIIGGNLCTYPQKTTNYNNERFYIVPSGGYYKIVNKKSFLVVDVENPGSLTDINSGTNISQYKDHDGDNQKWKFTLKNPSFIISTGSLEMTKGDTSTVKCTYGRTTYGQIFSCVVANPSVCSTEWGAWDGMTIPLKITAKASGETTITVYQKDYSTGIIYNTKTILVKVKKETNDSPVLILSKKANTIKVKAPNVTFKRSKLKKVKKFSIGVTKAQGPVTYTLDKKAKKAGIKVSKKGKVLIPKKCKKGTYKIVVKAAGNSIYKVGTKTVTIKIK